jgi:tRNA(Ile)-lysidine synthetase-like protein
MTGTVLVALSGGPDSTALLLMLLDQAQDVVAAHYDHALQPGSAAAARQVGELCTRLGVRLITERRSEELPKGSVQAAARALRYEFLGRAAAECGATTIALGHTADDLVEGAVMHLLRGSGIAGLRGMPSRRGVFVRPLIGVWRRDIDSLLERRCIVPLTDPANADRRYLRVRVRRDLLPRLERDRPGIILRLHAAAQSAAAMQSEVERRAGQVDLAQPLEAAEVAGLSEPVAVEVLRRLYAKAGGGLPGLARTHLETMLRLIRGGRGGRGVDLPGGLRFRVTGGRAEIVPRVSPLMEYSMVARPCGGCGETGAVHLRAGEPVRLGFRKPGLRMRPAGGRGTRKLQDILVDAHIPREERDHWPLVFSGDRLAWVPGVAVDADLAASGAEPALHVTVTRILSDRSPKNVVLESPDSPRGEPS